MAEAVDRVRLELTPALLVLPDSEAWRARTTREHRAIMRAIERGEVDAARRAMDRHLRGTEQGIRALLGAL
jgi:DNA-binding GntR family transcriptional regulator